MSRENIELVREFNDAIERRDWEAVAKRVHPDVVWRHNIGVGTPEEGEYKGRESVIALFERIIEPWEHFRPVAHDVRDVGGGVLVISGEMHVKHKASATEIVTPYEQRVELQSGLLARGETVQGMGARLGDAGT